MRITTSVDLRFSVPATWGESRTGRTGEYGRTVTLETGASSAEYSIAVSISAAQLEPNACRNSISGRAAPRVWRRSLHLTPAARDIPRLEVQIPDALLEELQPEDVVCLTSRYGQSALTVLRGTRIGLTVGAAACLPADSEAEILLSSSTPLGEPRCRCIHERPWLPLGAPRPGAAPRERLLFVLYGECLVAHTPGSYRTSEYDIWISDRSDPAQCAECIAVARRGAFRRSTAIQAAQLLDVFGVYGLAEVTTDA